LLYASHLIQFVFKVRGKERLHILQLSNSPVCTGHIGHSLRTYLGERFLTVEEVRVLITG
jgi:hypothetical protein